MYEIYYSNVQIKLFRCFKMNLKRIFLIGIFILILTVGAVSASDENATHELTIEDSHDLQTTDEGPQANSEGNVEVVAPKELYYNSTNQFDFKIKSGSGDFWLYIYVDNVSKTWTNVDNRSEDIVASLYLPIEEPGEYKVDVILSNDLGTQTLKSLNYTVKYFDIRVDPLFTIGQFDYRELDVLTPEGASGTLEFIMNGKTQKRTVNPDYSYLSFHANNPVCGLNNATFKFTADSKSKYKSQTFVKEFIVLPTITCDWRAKYSSEIGAFHIYAPGVTGIFNITVDGSHFKTVEVKDQATVSASGLSLGTHSYVAEFINDEFSTSERGEIEIVPNVNVSSFLRQGDDNYMTVTLPDDANGNLLVMLNKREIYRSANAKGFIKIPLADLIKSNRIDVNYTDDSIAYDDFFRATCTKNSPDWNMEIKIESLITTDNSLSLYADSNQFIVNRPDDYDGVITVFVDGKEVFSYLNFDFIGYDCYDGRNYGNVAYYYYKFDISKLKVGKHTLTAVADGSEYYKPTNATVTFTLTNLFPIFPKSDRIVYEDAVWDIYMPDDSTGTIKFYLDGKYVSTKKKGDSDFFTLPKNTKFGEHTLKFVYSGDKKYPKETITKKVNYTYEIFPRYRNWVFFNGEELIEGNKNILAFNCPSDFKGTVTLTIANQKFSKKANKGEVSFDLSKFKAGNYTLKVETQGSGKFTKQSFYMYDFEIMSKIVNIKADASSVYYDGYYTVKVTYVNGSVAKNVPVEAFFDGTGHGYDYSDETDSNGVVKFKMTEKPDKYEVTLTCKYSKVIKTVTVKNIVTLPVVKVKRSAKSLALTATIKQGNTPLSGRQVTFKFNGKTYKAKTNSKGVAKVTIPKSVLSKLKAGKKVTYQATYKKDTVKRTVSVLK